MRGGDAERSFGIDKLALKIAPFFGFPRINLHREFVQALPQDSLFGREVLVVSQDVV